MDAYASFEFVKNGHIVGHLDVQTVCEGVDNAAELCRTTVNAAYPHIEAYDGSPLPWVLTIRLGDEEEGRLMNRDFRHKDYATNVLSFPNDEQEPDASDWYVGDIFICVPVLQKEAVEMGKSVEAHLQHLVVHGLLHLVGYDHELGEKEAAAMEAMEIAILEDMGLPSPYGETA